MHQRVGAGQAGQGLRYHQRHPSRLSRPHLGGRAGARRRGINAVDPGQPGRPAPTTMHHSVGAGQAGQGLRYHQRHPSRLSRPVLAGAAGTGRDGAEPTPWVPRQPAPSRPYDHAPRRRGGPGGPGPSLSPTPSIPPVSPRLGGRGGDGARRRGINAVGPANANPRRPAPTQWARRERGETARNHRRGSREGHPAPSRPYTMGAAGTGQDGAEPTPRVPRRPSRAVPPPRPCPTA
jgi:hypothetical protein